MGCGCGKKGKRRARVQNMPRIKYDFTSDADFVQVSVNVSSIKILHTKTMPVSDFKAKYGIVNYGAVTNGTVVYVLQTDYDFYNQHNISGINLTLVNPVPVAAPVVQEVVEETGVADDLTKVTGIGAVTEKKLQAEGYYTYKSLEAISLEKWLEMNKTATEETYAKMMVSLEEILDRNT